MKLGIGIYEEENKKGQLVQKTDVHTHMLRGTFATRCAEAKIAPAVLKKILGHSDITITMQYYVDVDSEFESSENKNVEDYLIGKAIFGVDFSTEDKTLKILKKTRQNLLKFKAIKNFKLSTKNFNNLEQFFENIDI